MTLLEAFSYVLGSALTALAGYLLLSQRRAANTAPAPAAVPVSTEPLAVGRLRGGLLAFVCALIIDLFAVVLLFTPAPSAAFAATVTLIMLAVGGFGSIISAAGVVAVAPALGYSPGATAALAVCSLFPALGLVVILVMSAQSTATLRAAGLDSPFRLGAGPRSEREPDPSDTFDGWQ